MQGALEGLFAMRHLAVLNFYFAIIDKMEWEKIVSIFTAENFNYFVGFMSVAAALPVFKGWFFGILSWNKLRKIRSLNTEHQFILKMKDNPQEIAAWMLHSLLIIAAILAVAIMFQGIVMDQNGVKLASALQLAAGSVAYLFAVSTLGSYSRVKNHERSLARIENKLRELKNINPVKEF